MKRFRHQKTLLGRITACGCSLALAATAILLQNTTVPMLSASAALTAQSCALSGGADTGDMTDSYWRWSSVVTSYLYTAEDGTLVRFTADGSSYACAEFYESGETLTMKKNIIIPQILPVFGGFFAGETYNYIVTGQNNPDEDDTLPVFAVTKYDKDFNVLGNAFLSACNTTVPFDAGSLRMDESDGTLYIHTCHEMYETDDGYNHQANLTFYVDTESMAITYARYGISNIGTGYASHSFNQFVEADGNILYTLDHGDAYPRSVVLIARNLSTGYCSNINVLPIQGAVGDNTTKVNVGGLTVTEQVILTAGCSVPQDDTYDSAAQQNIYYTVTPKNSFSESSTELIYLTSFSEEDHVTVSAPKTVSLPDGGAAILWEETDATGTSMKVQLLDAYGACIDAPSVISGQLSSCEPIIYHDAIVWCVSPSGEEPILYTIPLNAADITDNNRVCVGSASAAAGDEVAVPIYIEQAVDWIGFGIVLTFDNRLTPVLLDDGTLKTASDSDIQLDTAISEDGTRIAISAITTEPINEDGELITLYFTVAEDAELSAEMSVSVTYAEVATNDQMIRETSGTDGIITVIPAETTTTESTTTTTTTESTTTTTTTESTTTTTTTESTTTTTTTESTTTTTTTESTTTTTTTESTTTTTTTESTTTTTTTESTTTTTTTESTTTTTKSTTEETTTTTEPVQTGLIGDVDGNGEINTDDAVLVLKDNATTMLGQPSLLTEDQLLRADPNKDGLIDADDASWILIYYANAILG